MTKLPSSLRLDRLLGNMGYGSRREIAMLARAERIVLDGVPVTAADRRIAVTTDLPGRMTVDGAPLDPVPGLVVMMNKPVGVTCSHKEAGPLVYSLLPPRWRRRDPAISTVGRLDKETSGLLLLTDDGELLHRIISPRSAIPKRYRVTLDRTLAGNEAELFASGRMMLEGEQDPLLPAVLEVLGDREARVTIVEGRYHQVRRMFAAAGNHVTALHRDRVGGLEVPADLAVGSYRLLGPAEIALVLGTSRTPG